jgi:hypothetical protein
MFDKHYSSKTKHTFEDVLLRKFSVRNENDFNFTFSIYDTSSTFTLRQKLVSARYMPSGSKIGFFKIEVESHNGKKQQMSFSIISHSYDGAEAGAWSIFFKMHERVASDINNITLLDGIHVPSIKKIIDEYTDDMLTTQSIIMHFQWEPMLDHKIKLDPKFFNF